MGGAIKWDPLGDIADISEQASQWDPLGDVRAMVTPDTPNTPEAASSGNVNKAAGGTLGGVGETKDSEEEAPKRRGVSKRKAGTIGKQIPLQATQSAPTTGIQI